MRNAAHKTAAAYAIDETVARTRAYYQRIIAEKCNQPDETDSLWMRARRSIAREMDIFGNFAHAAADAILPDDDGKVDEHG